MTWWERYKFRSALGLVMLFIFSTFMSCQEIRYSISGKTVQGKLKSLVERGSSGVIEYEFKADDGEWYGGRYQTDFDKAARIASEPLEVVYLPSDPRVHRLTLERTWVWPIIVLVMLAALAVWVIAVIRRAHR